MKNIERTIILGCGLAILTGCGGEEIASPGTSGDIIINNPAPPPPPPPPPGPAQVTPANGCPTINATGGLTNGGTITGPTGTYRVCELPAVIDADTTLPYISGLLYALPGRVDIGTDRGFASTGSAVELTIEPGVIVYGGTGRSYLVANRGNQLIANGSATRPIVFTSRDNVLGLSTDASTGQWGGVVLLGRAPVADCRIGGFNTAAAPTANATCEQELEGAATTTLFGGSNSADSSGSLRFVQIRYSGFALTTDRELQSLTTGGIGTGTTLENFMSFNSSDDGMEFFGGSVNMKRVVAIGADDDTFDVDSGAKANIQFAIAVQRAAGGDSLIELDSPDSAATPVTALPQTDLKIANFTFLERSTANGTVVRARGGAKLTLVNGVMDTDTETCVRIDEASTLAAAPTFSSVVGDCDPAAPFQGSSSVTTADVQGRWNAGTNNNAAFTISLAGFINGTNETGVAAFNPTSLSSFFTAVTYIGAVQNNADTWYRNWTCNSATADFGSSTGACTSLPVY